MLTAEPTTLLHRAAGARKRFEPPFPLLLPKTRRRVARIPHVVAPLRSQLSVDYATGTIDRALSATLLLPRRPTYTSALALLMENLLLWFILLIVIAACGIFGLWLLCNANSEAMVVNVITGIGIGVGIVIAVVLLGIICRFCRSSDKHTIPVKYKKHKKNKRGSVGSGSYYPPGGWSSDIGPLQQ
ncbi:hypothetical protein MTO96_008450 [Rhipicephalus appendiculatus]